MPSAPALEVRGLTRRYGARAAIRDLNLRVEEGDVYGFLGPNGAGKTTAMRCMLGLIQRDAGTVAIFGDDHPVRARRHVGAIIESPAFHDWLSGRANLRLSAAYLGLGGGEAEREIARVLERVGLTERAKDRAGTYSLGMRQRLAIARALLGKPKLLLLDEPTNGLDPRGMREVRELVRSLALHEALTVLISSHLLVEVQQICNRVGIVREGVLQAEGSVQELLAKGVATHTLVELGSPQPEALRDALAGIEGVAIEGAGQAGRLRVRLPTPMSVSALTRALITAGVDLDAVVPESRNLEDVFMELTG